MTRTQPASPTTEAKQGGDVPEWAFERMDEQVAKEPRQSHPRYTEVGSAFARYIAAHEEPPVDPLLIEARKLADDLGWFSANSLGLLHEGRFDGCATMQGLTKALRRGIELGREQGQ